MSFASLFVGPGTILLEFETADTRGEMAILWALVGAGAVYLGFAVVRMFMAKQDRARLHRLRDAGIGLVLIGGPLAVMTGAAPWTAAAAVWVLPVIAILFDRRLFLPLSRADYDDDGPLLCTKFLNVTLDADTDTLDGDVIRGRFAGYRLSEMSQDEVTALINEAASDPVSVSVLTGIFLQFRDGDRRGDDRAKSGTGRGRGRRAGAEGTHGGERPGTGMNVDEAHRVLGVAPGTGEAEILSAHRKLMKLVHPDTGGSDYLASKINEARDILLGR